MFGATIGKSLLIRKRRLTFAENDDGKGAKKLGTRSGRSS